MKNSREGLNYSKKNESPDIGINIGNYKDVLKRLSDSQELKLFGFSHQDGSGGLINKITAGDLRRQLSAEEAEPRYHHITFADGSEYVWDDNDNYSIQKITPEMKTSDDKKEKILQEVQALTEIGVPPGLFLRYNEQSSESDIFFTPDDIVRFAKIIEEFNNKRKDTK